MPVCTKSERHRTYCAPVAFLLLWLFTSPVPAAGFSVQEVETEQWTNRIYLSATIAFDLSDEALRALENGVVLHLLLEIEVLQKRRWLWDKRIANNEVRYQLEHQALSNLYLVSHDDYNIRRTFRTLARALDFVGKLNDYLLADISNLNPGNNYYGRLRARLDIESLPAPMRPMAYVSSQWRLTSSWYHWPIDLLDKLPADPQREPLAGTENQP